MFILFGFIVDGKTLNTCCGVDQLRTMGESIVIAANFLHRCPSCMRTFSSFICEMVCSPKQSQFMNVTKLSKSGQYLRSANYIVDDEQIFLYWFST